MRKEPVPYPISDLPRSNSHLRNVTTFRVTVPKLRLCSLVSYTSPQTVKTHWHIASDSSSAALELRALALQLNLNVEVTVLEQFQASTSPTAIGWIVGQRRLPEISSMIRWSTSLQSNHQTGHLAILGNQQGARVLRTVGAQMGLLVFSSLGAFTSSLAIDSTNCDDANLDELETWERELLCPGDKQIQQASARSGSLTKIVRKDAELQWVSNGAEHLRLGRIYDLAEVLYKRRKLRNLESGTWPVHVRTNRENALDVIFGPPRSLSDPASKAALSTYGISIPEEELCTSASRAASEANRIGYPVRLSLASPDLRIWDHPELCVESVENAARVREAYRQVTELAASKANARILGVLISKNRRSHTKLKLRFHAVDSSSVLCAVSFACTSGYFPVEEQHLLLPQALGNLGRIFSQANAFSGLNTNRPRASTQGVIGELEDFISRTGSLVHDLREEVTTLRVDPLRLLTGGGIELRECCIEVSDAFAKQLEQLP